jgi:hypothetical protein
MDIEGAELDALEGAKDTMKNLRPEILACTYHLPSHYEEITAFLTQQGYEVRVSKGVISTEGDYGERPHFRKGLVFAYPAAG